MLISSLAAPLTPTQALSSSQFSQLRLKPSHWVMTCPHPGTRFLKDAMWKRDKKDFACEMRKLKRLKGQLVLMEQDYLIEYQVRGRGAGHQLLSRYVSRRQLTCVLRIGARSSPIQKELPSLPPLTNSTLRSHSLRSEVLVRKQIQLKLSSIYGAPSEALPLSGEQNL